jgi:hypothetical protein
VPGFQAFSITHDLSMGQLQMTLSNNALYQVLNPLTIPAFALFLAALAGCSAGKDFILSKAASGDAEYAAGQMRNTSDRESKVAVDGTTVAIRIGNMVEPDALREASGSPTATTIELWSERAGTALRGISGVVTFDDGRTVTPRRAEQVGNVCAPDWEPVVVLGEAAGRSVAVPVWTQRDAAARVRRPSTCVRFQYDVFIDPRLRFRLDIGEIVSAEHNLILRMPFGPATYTAHTH